MGQSGNIFLLAHDGLIDAAEFQKSLFNVTPTSILHHTNQLNQVLHSVREYLPDIIFMNTDIGGVSSARTLIKLKEDLHLKKIPVVIYSTPRSISELKEFYMLGAARYLEQPVTKSGIILGLEMILYLFQKGQLIPPEFDEFLITTNYQHFTFTQRSNFT